MLAAARLGGGVQSAARCAADHVRGPLHYAHPRRGGTRCRRYRLGRPLVRLDTAAIGHRVEALPEVATVDVTASYPSTVVDHGSPSGSRSATSRTAPTSLVDRTGRQFRTGGDGARAACRGSQVGAAASAGQRGRGGDRGERAAGIVPALLASVQADDPRDLLVLRDERIVRWGGPDRSADKARVLAGLLARPGTAIRRQRPDFTP